MSPVVDKYANECKEYWWLFPLAGIKVTDFDTDFSNPSFGNATMLSTECAKNLFAKMPELLNSSEDPVISKLVDDSTDSLIAVRWEVSEIGNGPWSQSERTQDAAERAQEIASLLTLFTAEKTNFKKASGLCSHISQRSDRHLAIASDGKSLMAIQGARDHIQFSKASTEISRDELIKEISSSNFGEVFTLLVHKQDEIVHQECRNSLAAALSHLASGLYVNEHSEITANSVTCIELLLKSQEGVKDKEIKSRLSVLTTQPRELIDRVYHARNGWLHNGQRNSKEQAREAMTLALATIKEFAKLIFAMPPLSNRLILTEYLDGQKK